MQVNVEQRDDMLEADTLASTVARHRSRVQSPAEPLASDYAAWSPVKDIKARLKQGS